MQSSSEPQQFNSLLWCPQCHFSKEEVSLYPPVRWKLNESHSSHGWISVRESYSNFFINEWRDQQVYLVFREKENCEMSLTVNSEADICTLKTFGLHCLSLRSSARRGNISPYMRGQHESVQAGFHENKIVKANLWSNMQLSQVCSGNVKPQMHRGRTEGGDAFHPAVVFWAEVALRSF